MAYQEIQRFSSLVWVWLIVLPIAGFVWFVAYQQESVKTQYSFSYSQ